MWLLWYGMSHKSLMDQLWHLRKRFTNILSSFNKLFHFQKQLFWTFIISHVRLYRVNTSKNAKSLHACINLILVLIGSLYRRQTEVHLLSDLHVSSLCCFYGCVDQTFPTSHSVEEELGGGQTRIKAVCHKALRSRELKHKRTITQTWCFYSTPPLIWVFFNLR